MRPLSARFMRRQPPSGPSESVRLPPQVLPIVQNLQGSLSVDQGFKLVKAGVDLIGGGPSKVYEVVVRRDQGMIQVLVDGQASVEWEDPYPYGGGYFGLRQMWQTNSSVYPYFEVASLE